MRSTLRLGMFGCDPSFANARRQFSLGHFRVEVVVRVRSLGSDRFAIFVAAFARLSISGYIRCTVITRKTLVRVFL